MLLNSLANRFFKIRKWEAKLYLTITLSKYKMEICKEFLCIKTPDHIPNSLLAS